MHHDASVVAVEAAVKRLHEAAGAIKGFLTAQSAEDEPAATGSYRSLIDEFLTLIREAVAAAAGGALRDAPAAFPRTLTSAHLTSSTTVEVENTRLRALVDGLTHQLRHELSLSDGSDANRRLVVDHLEALRLDGSIVKVYQDRIAELLRLMEAHTLPTAEALRSIALTTEDQLKDRRAALVANDLGRLTANMKDRLDRANAEKAKMQADLTALLAENAILFDRVSVLEAQLGAMASSASGTLKELERQRVRTAIAISTPPRSHTPNPTPATLNRSTASPAPPPQSNTTIRIGGVVIDKDVAVWMSDMYDALSRDPETASLVPPRPGSSKPAKAAPGGAVVADAVVKRISSASKERSSVSGGSQSGSRFASHVTAIRNARGPSVGE